MKDFDRNISFRKNFPNIQYDCNKYILPIFPQYHTTLLPDSKLNNENKIDFLGREPHRYALQKVYISWAPGNGVKPGDLILFYRTGPEGSNKNILRLLQQSLWWMKLLAIFILRRNCLVSVRIEVSFLPKN